MATRSSRQAVGTIQTDGFPPVLAAADAMLKAGNVTLVYYGLAERAEFMISIRGPVSEVNQAVAAGVCGLEDRSRLQSAAFPLGAARERPPVGLHRACHVAE